MDHKTDTNSVSVLRAYAEGRVHHLNRGLCPDIVEGHDSRDPDCPVCASLAASAATDCARCSGSGEDPEGFYDQSRGDAGHTHDGPCRSCGGSGAAASAGSEPVAAPPMDGEIALIEKAVRRAGITSLLNHGAASCVFTEGCAGVSQEHLLAYTREIALHCAVALGAGPSSSDTPPADEKPVAWAIFAPNGNIRMWSVKPDEVARAAAGFGQEPTPLYTHPSPPEGAGWRPIETAPKDGALFLCWVAAVRYGETDDGQQFQQDVSQVDFCSWRRQAEAPDGGWFDPCCGQIADAQGVTHWMPLPAPPASEAKERGNG